jgi:hypothetical protein
MMAVAGCEEMMAVAGCEEVMAVAGRLLSTSTLASRADGVVEAP